MALRLGSLYVSLSADAGAFVKGFQNASAAAEKATKEIKRVAGEVAQVSAIFAGVAGAAVKLASSVDGPTKKAMDGLEKSTKLLAVQVADLLLPAVRQVTEMFRTAAGFVAGLSPPMRQAASTAAVLAVQLAVAGKALSVVAGGASSVFSIMKGLASAIGAVGVGPILAVAATVALVAGAVLLVHRAWRKNWGGIQQVTGEVLEWFRDAFGKFATFMKGVWDFLVDGAAAFVDGLLAVGDVLERVTGKNLGVGGLREGFSGLWKDLKSGSFFSEAFKFGKSVGEQIADGISEEWAELKKSLNFGALASGQTIGLGRGMGGPGASVSSGHEGVAAYALAEQERAAARALKDITDEAQRFKKAVASMAAEREVRAWLRDIEPRERVGMNTATRAGIGGGSAWRDAMSTVAKQAAADLRRATSGIANVLTQSSGELGRVIGNIAQAAQQGGPWAALIAAVMEVLAKTEAWQQFMSSVAYGLERLGQMVGPLVEGIIGIVETLTVVGTEILAPIFNALQPLFDGLTVFAERLIPIMTTVGALFEGVAPIIELIATGVGKLLEALAPVLDVITGVLKVVATVVLGMIIAANEIAAAFGDQKARAEANRLSGIIEALWAPNANELAIAQSEAARETWRNAAAQGAAATAAKSFSEAYTNLPAGYRVQMAKYDADLGMGSSWAGAGGGGTTTIINGPVTITTNGTPEDGEALAEEIEAANRRQRGQTSGNPTANNKTGRDPYR